MSTFWDKTRDFQRDLVAQAGSEHDTVEAAAKALGLSVIGLQRQAARLGVDLKALLRKEPRSTVGTNLRRLRVAKGLTLTELAELSGVSRVTLGQLENTATHSPRLSTLQVIAAALGQRIEALTTQEKGPI